MIVWGPIIRVKIVFLALKIYLVCYFIGNLKVLGLREAQRVCPSIVLLKLRRTTLVLVLRHVGALENTIVDVKAVFHKPIKRKLFLITQS